MKTIFSIMCGLALAGHVEAGWLFADNVPVYHREHYSKMPFVKDYIEFVPVDKHFYTKVWARLEVTHYDGTKTTLYVNGVGYLKSGWWYEAPFSFPIPGGLQYVKSYKLIGKCKRADDGNEVSCKFGCAVDRSKQ